MIKQSVKLWLPQLQDNDEPGTSSSQKECPVVGHLLLLDFSFVINAKSKDYTVKIRRR